MNSGNIISLFLAILVPFLLAATMLRAMYEAALEDPVYRKLKAEIERGKS